MLKVVVIGASRGIGLGFTKAYLSEGHQVIASYRNNGRAEALLALKKTFGKQLQCEALDVTSQQDIEHFNQQLPEKIDILIINAGIMLCPPGSQPQTETIEQMRQTMEVNTYAPENIMRSLFPKLLEANATAVYISSSLAHYADNLKGRYQSYRASKIAANILFQNWNIELAKAWRAQEKDAETRPCAFPISPGVVKTDMGGETAPLTVEESVGGMMKVIQAMRLHKQSGFYLYDGSLLEAFPQAEVL